ncbi:MAG: pitrilysin family protein, partial [Ilumatobacteraceae bacterium]
MSGLKSSVIVMACAFASALAPAGPARAQAAHWKQIKRPALSEFTIQQPRRIQLANGMVIFLQEDHELPLIRGSVVIRGGSRDEPADKLGLTGIYGEAWRTGGTRSRTGDALDDLLEMRAAKVETSADIDSAAISFDALKGDFDEVFSVVVDLLRQPEFREDKIVLAKTQLNTGIARRNDDPGQIARRESTRLGYGAASPYGRVEEYYTVNAVSRQDLVAWHRHFTHPNNMILGVIGDFDSAAMEAKLRRAFEGLPKGPELARFQTAITDPKPGVYFVGKDDINQSTIQMVHLGTTRDNPDYYALEVMNEILGGGFSGRLLSNIRSKKGLAYSVGGGVGSSWDHPGLFRLSMGTKSGTTAAAIDALYEELDTLKKSAATPLELERAKESILNSFVFRFDSRQKILAERMNLEFYGYPADFTARYRTGIEQVTAADVERVARKYVDRDKLAVLVVGKAADFDRPLASYGTVTPVDITIPTAAPGAVAAVKVPAASNADGKALLGKVIASLGGVAKIRAIQAVRQTGSAALTTPQGAMTLSSESLVVFPDRVRQSLVTPMGQMTMVASGSSGFMSMPQGVRDMPASQRDALLGAVRQNPLYVAQHADDPAWRFTAGGTEKVGAVDARVLDIAGEGVQVRWYVDPASGRVLRSLSRETGAQGPVEQVSDFSDFRATDGISAPFKIVQTQGGQPYATITITEVDY